MKSHVLARTCASGVDWGLREADADAVSGLERGDFSRIPCAVGPRSERRLI